MMTTATPYQQAYQRLTHLASSPKTPPALSGDLSLILLMAAECERAQEQLVGAQAEATAYAQKLALLRCKLEEIVCTEPPDDGVVLLSYDGPTREPTAEEKAAGWTHPVYVHEHFSPLGDALIELWGLTEL